MTRIRAVTLDLWGTLISDNHSVEERRALRSEIISRHLGEACPLTHEQSADIQTATWSWFQEIYEADWRTPTPAEILAHILDLLGKRLDRGAFEALAAEFQEVSLRFPPDPLTGAVDAVRDLAARVPLAIISDTGFTPGSVIRKIFTEIGLGPFGAMTFSDEQERSKPHRSAFLRTLGELDVEPAEALHIGDTERTDIVGARSVGMRAILYARGGETPPDGTAADGVLTAWPGLWPLLEEAGMVLAGER